MEFPVWGPVLFTWTQPISHQILVATKTVYGLANVSCSANPGHCVQVQTPLISLATMNGDELDKVRGTVEDLDLVMPAARSILGPLSYMNHQTPLCQIQ